MKYVSPLSCMYVSRIKDIRVNLKSPFHFNQKRIKNFFGKSRFLLCTCIVRTSRNVYQIERKNTFPSKEEDIRKCTTKSQCLRQQDNVKLNSSFVSFFMLSFSHFTSQILIMNRQVLFFFKNHDFFAILHFLFQIVLYMGYPTNGISMLNLPRREEKKDKNFPHSSVVLHPNQQ